MLTVVVACIAVYRKAAGEMEATSPTVMTALVSLSFLLCVTAILVVGKWIYQPELVVNDEGIRDNSFFGIGKICWKEIASVETRESKRGSVMIICLKDPLPFINSRKGLKYISLNKNIKHHGTPSVISLNGLSLSKKDITDAAKECLIKSEQISRIPEGPWYA
jgi:hypothetical protein